MTTPDTPRTEWTVRGTDRDEYAQVARVIGEALLVAEDLESVLERRKHRKILVFRPLYAVGGQELGYLPGPESENYSVAPAETSATPAAYEAARIPRIPAAARPH
jgi:hypothetical protein